MNTSMDDLPIAGLEDDDRVDTVVPAGVQVIYLDFDGAETRYNGEALTLDKVVVDHSGLDAGSIAAIAAKLNEDYAGRVVFVTEPPPAGEYSTVYVGKSAAFRPYGHLAGIAETIDHGNANRSDNAFVNLDASCLLADIAGVIAHETDHLLGTLDHGGGGIAAYACYSYNNTMTNADFDQEHHQTSSVFKNPVNFSECPGSGAPGHETYYLYSQAFNITIPAHYSVTVYDGGVVQGVTVDQESSYLAVNGGGVASDIYVGATFPGGYNGTASCGLRVNTGAVLENVIVDAGNFELWDCTVQNLRVLHGGYGYADDVTLTDIHIVSGGVELSGVSAVRNVVVENGSFSGGFSAAGTTVENIKVVKGQGSISAGSMFGNIEVHTGATLGVGAGASISGNVTVVIDESPYYTFLDEYGKPQTGINAHGIDLMSSGQGDDYKYVNSNIGSISILVDINAAGGEYTVFRWEGPTGIMPYASVSASISGSGADVGPMLREVFSDYGNGNCSREIILDFDPYAINYGDTVVRENEQFSFELPGNAFYDWNSKEIDEYTVGTAPDWVTVDQETGKFGNTPIGDIIDGVFGTTFLTVTARNLFEKIRDFQLEMVVVPEVINGLGRAMTDVVEVAVTNFKKHVKSFSVDAPDAKAGIFGLELALSDMAASCESADGRYVILLQGKFELTVGAGEKAKTVTAELSGEDDDDKERGLTLKVVHDFSTFTWDVYGELAVSEFKLAGFEFSDITLSVNTATKSWEGSGKVKLPGIKYEFGGGVGFTEGKLDSIAISVGDLNVAVGTSGAFLQSVEGKLANLADAQKSIQIEGEIGFTYGPEITVSGMPGWSGIADGEYSLLSFAITGEIDAEHIAGGGSLDFLEGMMTGEAAVDFNWKSNTLEASGEFKLFGDLITVTGKLTGNDTSISMTGTGTIEVPDFGPFSGRSFSGSAALQFSDNGDNSDDYVIAWGSTTVMNFETVFGFKVYFNGSFSVIGADGVPEPDQSYRPPLDAAGGLAAEKSWTIGSFSGITLLGCSWESGEGVTVTLVDNLGNTYDAAAIAAAANMEVVSELSGPNSISIAIANAAAGSWKLIVNNAVNPVFSASYMKAVDPAKPEITGITVDADTRRAAQIDYSLGTSALAAGTVIGIYCDNDQIGHDGFLVMRTEAAALTGGFQFVLPDTLAGGSYYFYAVRTDSGLAPVYGDYFAAAADFADAGDREAPETPKQLSGTDDNGTIVFQWAAAEDAAEGLAAGYLLRYGTTEDLSGAAVIEVVGTAYTGAPAGAGRYFFQVAARDAAGNLSDWSAVGSYTPPVPFAHDGETLTGTAEVRNILTISAGQTAKSMTVGGYAEQHLADDGAAVRTTLLAGGSQVVSSGGVAAATLVSSGGAQIVRAWGAASATEILAGGSAGVYVGGTIRDFQVRAGAELVIDVGVVGEALSNVAYLNGALKLGGRLTLNKELDAGGAAVVWMLNEIAPLAEIRIDNIAKIRHASYQITVAAAQAHGCYRLAGGAADFSVSVGVENEAGSLLGTLAAGESFQYNGTTYSLVLNGEELLFAVLGSEGVRFYTDGLLTEFADHATGRVLAAGGIDLMEVVGAGTAEDTLVSSGGRQLVGGGGAVDRTNLTGGIQTVRSGGSAANTVVGVNGLQQIESGGVATGTFIHFGGSQYVAGGSSYGTLVSGGSQVVSDQGLAVETQVSSYAAQSVGSGGRAELTLLAGGTQCVLEGGVAGSTLISSGGEQYVSSGGIASATRIESMGRQTVFSGGTAVGTMVNGGTGEYLDGGRQYVSDGGVAVSTMINSGGRQYVSSGGVAVSTMINSGGSFSCLSGGSASGMLVLAGGTAEFSDCSTFSDAVVEAGGQLYTYGETSCSGTIMLTGELIVFAQLNAAGAEIVMDVAHSVSAADYFIANFSGILGADYAISVAADQNQGLYTLGAMAGNFNQTVTVRDSSGTEFGTVAVGGHLRYGEKYYSLVEADDVLYLYVTVSDTPPVIHIGPVKLFSDGLVVEAAGGMSGRTLTEAGFDAMLITSGGSADATVVGAGTSQTITSGGLATNTEVRSGGVQEFSDDAYGANITVRAGGKMTVSGYGVTMTGDLVLGGELVVSGSFLADGDSRIIFDLNERSGGDGVIIDQLDRIAHQGECAISIAADQAAGIYRLAAGAADFNERLAVYAGDATLGYFYPGNSFVAGDYLYRLDKEDGTLVFEVTKMETNLVGSLFIASAVFHDGSDYHVDWLPEDGAVYYTLQLKDTDGNVVSEQTGLTATRADVSVTAAGTYTIRVEAYGADDVLLAADERGLGLAASYAEAISEGMVSENSFIVAVADPAGGGEDYLNSSRYKIGNIDDFPNGWDLVFADRFFGLGAMTDDMLAVSNEDGFVEVYRVADGALRLSEVIQVGFAASAFCLSSDGSYLAADQNLYRKTDGGWTAVAAAPAFSEVLYLSSGLLIARGGVYAGADGAFAKTFSFGEYFDWGAAADANQTHAATVVGTWTEDAMILSIESYTAAGGFWSANDSVTVSGFGDGHARIENLQLNGDYLAALCRVFSEETETTDSHVLVYRYGNAGWQEIYRDQVADDSAIFWHDGDVYLVASPSAVPTVLEFGAPVADQDDWLDLAEAYANRDAMTRIAVGDAAGDPPLFRDHVGFGDAVDYRAVTLAAAGRYTFDITGTDAVKMTIYRAVNGKFAAVKAVSVAAGVAGTIPKLLLESGTYYFAVLSPNAAKGGDADYTVSLDPASVFFDEANQAADDDWRAAELPTLDCAPGGVIEDEWVGFGDKLDYRKLVVGENGSYDFTIAGLENAVKLTLYVKQVNSKGVEALKQLKSITVTPKRDKLGNLIANTGGVIAGQLLEAGKDYYLAADATGAARGLNSPYRVTVSGTQFIDSDQAADDDWNAPDLPELDCVPGGVIEGEWVGFGDKLDYRKLVVGENGSYDFTIAGLENGVKLTLYTRQVNSKGVESLKKLKGITVSPKFDKAGNRIADTGVLAGQLLRAGGDYYLAVEASGAVKGKNSPYDVTISGTVFDNEFNQLANNVWNDAEVGVLDPAAGVAGEWVGFGDAVDFFQFALDEGDIGRYGFRLDSAVEKMAAMTLYRIDLVNGVEKLTKLKTGVAFADVELKTGRYALEVKSADSGKGVKNTGYGIAVDLPNLDGYVLDGSIAMLTSADALDGAGPVRDDRQTGMLA